MCTLNKKGKDMPTTAMAAIATTQATIATAAAHNAQVAQCKTLLPIFNAQTATTQEIQEYDQCVHILYPKEFGADVIIALKLLFVVALLGMVFALWKTWCDDRHSAVIDDYILMGIIGFFVTPFLVLLLALICYGIFWLFS